MLLPLLSTGGIAYPGFTTLTGKNLIIWGPHDPITPILNLSDADFRNSVNIGGYKFGIAVKGLVSSYDEGQTMEIVTSEDWSNPQLVPGCKVEFYGSVSNTHNVYGTQPSWVLNALGTGIQLLFSGKIDDVQMSGDPSTGSGISYSCRGWMAWADLVDVVLDFPNGFRLPERIYNADPTDDQAEYKRSIKKSTALITNASFYKYTPFGYTGIAPPDLIHGSGAPQNTAANRKMKVGEIIKDLFGSHGLRLKREGVVPDSWDYINQAGIAPYVQAELDTLSFIPDKTVLAGMKFLEAIKYVVRRTYPNYSVWVDRAKIWHFTPVLDNLTTDAQAPVDVFLPAKWASSRLGVILLKLAEPVGGNDKRVFGKLIQGSIAQRISDRYTAVRIVGHEIVVTSEASTLNGSLKNQWGYGNAAQQTNLQSGYMAGGLDSSVNRHWDRGDANMGIPVYKMEALTGTVVKISFKGGYRSELWPHTNDEWNGTTVLLASSLNLVQTGTFSWVQAAERYTVLDCYNILDIDGAGTPGFALEVEGRNQLSPGAFITEFSSGSSGGAQIQLTDDFGLETTISPNQLSVTYRMFKIEETTATYGDSLNSDPSTPCNIRGIVALGNGRTNSPSGGIPGNPNPGSLEAFGQSLGGTAATAMGRLHSKAGGGGEFWFGGSLIIPFSALRRGSQKLTNGGQGIPNQCVRGGSLPAPEVKVVYEKSTQTFREIRVPALAPSGEETFAGTSYIISGVRRELVIKAERFIDNSQKPEFEKLAAAILRTVSDLEPSGDWEWIETSRYLSLSDLHFRLDVDWYHQWGIGVGVGGGNNTGIRQAVVTRISYDFESETATMSLDTRYNPLGAYSYDTLRDAIISAKRLKEIEEARQKSERTKQCLDSIQSYRPTNELILPQCQDAVLTSSGPGKGKPGSPVSCHATDDMVKLSIGPEGTAAAGSGGGYALSQYPNNFSLNEGIGWYLDPFFDTLGNLFFYDRYGGIQAGDRSALTEGNKLHPSINVDNTNANWKNDPLRKSQEMASLALSLLRYLFGANSAEPIQTKYNTVTNYNPTTGVVTLTYDNLIVNGYTNGLIAINGGPTNQPLLYVASNTAGTVTLKLPGGGYPPAGDILVGDHVYLMAQRKPLPNSSLAAGTRMLKDTAGTWFAVEPTGVVKAVTISGATDFTPIAAYNAGGAAPVFSKIPAILL